MHWIILDLPFNMQRLNDHDLNLNVMSLKKPFQTLSIKLPPSSTSHSLSHTLFYFLHTLFTASD